MEENKKEKKVDLEEKTDIKDEKKSKKEGENKKESNSANKTKEKVNTNEKVEEEKTGVKEEEEAKFRKVESKNKKNVNTPEKKHTILKAILIIIGILVVAYCVFVFRNYFILKDILVKAGRFENIESYSYVVNVKQGDVEFNKTHIIKDDVERMDLENVTMPEKNLIVWKDNNTNEGIVAFPSTKNAIKSNDKESIFIGDNFPFRFAKIDEGMPGLILFCLMYTDEFNGKDCYVIQIASDYRIWVEKETGLVVKEEGNGSIDELTDLKIENIEDIYKPDLTGYEVKEQ